MSTGKVLSKCSLNVLIIAPALPPILDRGQGPWTSIWMFLASISQGPLSWGKDDWTLATEFAQGLSSTWSGLARWSP